MKTLLVVVFLLASFLPYIHASLQAPELVSKFSIPFNITGGVVYCDSLDVDSQFFYLTVRTESNKIMLLVMNYSIEGHVTLVSEWVVVQHAFPEMFSFVNVKPGVVAVSYSAYGTHTFLLVIDVVANVINSTKLKNIVLSLQQINPMSKEYAMYGTAISNKPKFESTIFLFKWDSDGQINLNPINYTIPKFDHLLFGSSYLHVIRNDGAFCSYRFPPLSLNVSCYDLVKMIPAVMFFSLSSFYLSRSGERLFFYLMEEEQFGYALAVFDISETGVELFTISDFSRVDYLPRMTYQISYHGDFYLQSETFLVDSSSEGLPSYIFHFADYYHLAISNISPDDKFIFVAVVERGANKSVDILGYDVNPVQLPFALGHTNEIREGYSMEAKLVMDENLGFGFFTSTGDTPLFRVNLGNMDLVAQSMNNTLDFDNGIVGPMFKDFGCSWYSVVSLPPDGSRDKSISVLFFLVNETTATCFNTISIKYWNVTDKEFVIPAGHKMWIAPSGELYAVIIWAAERIPQTEDMYGYANATLSVYHIPLETSFPKRITGHASATLNLGVSVPVNTFTPQDFLQNFNFYNALWSEDVSSAENLNTTGEFTFSAVLGVNNERMLQWLTFSYMDASRTLSIVQNNTLQSSCKVLQSLHVNNSIWLLCGTRDNLYEIHRYTTNLALPDWTFVTYTATNHTQYNFEFAWWISNDEKRLVISNTTAVYVFDIDANRLTYHLTTGTKYLSGGIYHVSSPSTYMLALMTTISLEIYYDCGPGSKPNRSNYCSKCKPGTHGHRCAPCPAGYICAEYGIAQASTLCPAGNYCPEGTSNNKVGHANGPQICLPGTYCPKGMATHIVGTDITSPKECMARFFCPAGSSLPTEKSCPPNTISEIGAKSINDCVCESGHFGYGGFCILCPPKCYCHSDVLSNCWIRTPFINTSHTPSLCPVNSVLGTTACNPNKTRWHGEKEFPCAIGYSDRECSKCEQGYYASGRTCSQCRDYFKFLPALYISIVILLLYYAWNIKPANSAILKIVTVHFQSILIFIVGGMDWDAITSKFLHSSSSSFNFSLSAIECLYPSWKLLESLIFAVTLPFATGVLAIIAGVVVWFWRGLKIRYEICMGNLEPQSNSFSFVWSKVAKTMATLVDLLYFSIALRTFQVLGCTSFSSGDGFYLSSYPWLQCNNKSWAPYFGIGLGAAIVEVLAPPIVLLMSLRKYRNRLVGGNAKAVVGSFYLVYTRDNYLWEGVVIFRRLVIAFLSTIIPYGSIILFVALFIVFHVYAIALVRRMPYTSRRDNVMDVVSQCILLTTLYCGFFVDFAGADYREFKLSYFAGMANLVFMMVGLVYIFYETIYLKGIHAIITWILTKVRTSSHAEEAAVDLEPLIHTEADSEL